MCSSDCASFLEIGVTMPHLPNEILLKVFFYLEEDTRSEPWKSDKPVSQAFPGIAALSQICLASKRFNTLATPLLYHSLPAQLEKPRLLLFRTLSQRPDLARHAKRISLRASTKPSQAVNDAWITIRRGAYLPARLKNRITRALRLVVNDDVVYDDYPLIHTWTGSISGDYEHNLSSRYPQWQDKIAQDAEVAVFLALVPDVESLDLYIPFRYELLLDTFRASISTTRNFRKLGEITRTTLRKLGAHPRRITELPITPQIPIPLSRVRHLHVAQWGPSYAIWMPYFRESLLLPTLTELSCNMANFCGFLIKPNPSSPHQWPPAPRPWSSLPPPSLMPMSWSWRFRPQRLERIDLDNSNIDAVGFITLLRVYGARREAPPSTLHTLRIRWGSGCVSDSSILDFNVLGFVLRYYQGRIILRTLDLDYRFALTINNRIEKTLGKLGSLRELDGLESLGIAYRMLIGSPGSAEAEDVQLRPRLTDILPTTLRSLHVTVFQGEKNTENLYAELAELIRDERFPGLRQIRKIQTEASKTFISRPTPMRWMSTGEGIVLEWNATPIRV
ncbi:hypothetical protein SLS62_000108 [Diatrype stigma]|uniref:F-box domain-containing protein n=1 Tax=Diatrype stigma TaxID=117547 RepID=A0AAN9YXS7_9PEZI